MRLHSYITLALVIAIAAASVAQASGKSGDENNNLDKKPSPDKPKATFGKGTRSRTVSESISGGFNSLFGRNKDEKEPKKAESKRTLENPQLSTPSSTETSGESNDAKPKKPTKHMRRLTSTSQIAPSITTQDDSALPSTTKVPTQTQSEPSSKKNSPDKDKSMPLPNQKSSRAIMPKRSDRKSMMITHDTDVGGLGKNVDSQSGQTSGSENPTISAPVRADSKPTFGRGQRSKTTSEKKTDDVPRPGFFRGMSRALSTKKVDSKVAPKGVPQPNAAPVAPAVKETLFENNGGRVRANFGAPLAPGVADPFLSELFRVVEGSDAVMDSEGVYRLSAQQGALMALKDQIEGPEGGDIANQVELLPPLAKLYVRNVPGGMKPSYTDMLQLHPLAVNKDRRGFIEHFRTLPLEWQLTIRCIARHFNVIVDHSEANKMKSNSLAIVMGPNLFNTDPQGAKADPYGDAQKPNDILEYVMELEAAGAFDQ